MKSRTLTQIKVLCGFLGFCSGLMFAIGAYYLAFTAYIISFVFLVGPPDSGVGDETLIRAGASVPAFLVLLVLMRRGWKFGGRLLEALESSADEADSTKRQFFVLVAMGMISLAATVYFVYFYLNLPPLQR